MLPEISNENPFDNRLIAAREKLGAGMAEDWDRNA